MDKFKINKYSLAFDFDGVLCDSQEECFEVACKLFIKEESASDIQKFYNSNKKNIFSYRPYIINGEDYYFIIKALYSGVKLKNQFEFEDYKISNQHIIKKIRKKFYETRKLLIQKDLKYWISKNPLYEHIPNALNELMKKYDIYIITTKDKISVQKILFHYKIYVDPDNIFFI